MNLASNLPEDSHHNNTVHNISVHCVFMYNGDIHSYVLLILVAWWLIAKTML